jgi:hypothetical protein
MLIGVLYFTRPVVVAAESEVDTPVIDINSDVNAKAE